MSNPLCDASLTDCWYGKKCTHYWPLTDKAIKVAISSGTLVPPRSDGGLTRFDMTWIAVCFVAAITIGLVYGVTR